MNAALERSLSRERLDKYLIQSKNDLDLAIALYERNARLSEALYSPLQSLEVCLRNHLDLGLIARYGADWTTSGSAPLDNDGREEIDRARRALKLDDQTPGKIMAELRFGFWVGLLGPRYDATLWRQALHKSFRAKGGMQRKPVHARMNALRRFRNRIAHHEPIFHRPVEALHSEIVEAIGWMCSETSAWTVDQSRFQAVYDGEVV